MRHEIPGRQPHDHQADHRRRSQLLAALRGNPRDRPPVDPDLAGGLTAWLEDGIAPVVGQRPLADRPLVLRPFDVWRASGPPAAEVAAVAAVESLDSQSAALQRAVSRQRMALARGLFRHLLTVGRFYDPFDDGTDQLGAEGNEEVGNEFWECFMSVDSLNQAQLRHDAHRFAEVLERSWCRLPSSWLPRTFDRVVVPLAGGRVELKDLLDLVVGDAPSTHAAVCIVQLRVGEPQAWHREDLASTALVETLRTGTAPFRVASFSLADGSLDTIDVDDSLLVGAVERTVAAVAAAAAVATTA